MELFGTIFGVGALALLALMVGVFSRWGSRSGNEELPVPKEYPIADSIKSRLMKYPGMRMNVNYYQAGKKDITEINLKYRMANAGEFSICHEGAVSRLKKKVGIEDVKTGDPEFDERMLVQGAEPRKLLAFLNQDVRSAILKLDSSSIDFWFTWNELVLSFRGGEGTVNRRVERTMETIHRILDDFFSEKGLNERYILLVRYDTVPGVRLAALGALAARYPSDAKSVVLFRECLDDKNFSIAFGAAVALGEEGMAHLAKMLAGGKDLKSENRIEIIRAFGKHGYCAGIPVLLDLLYGTSNEEEIEILNVLKDLGDASCSDFLLKKLPRTDPEVQPHIRDALAACGTTETVKKLRAMSTVVRGRVIRSIYDDIADRIAARLGKTSGGWLSEPETAPMEGALSRNDLAGEGALSGEGKSRN